MSSGMLSRFWVSSAFEGTAGIPATVDKSFYPKLVNINFKEDHSKNDEVTGFRNAVQETREQVMAGGGIDHYIHPDWAAWLCKMLYGNSPASALVAPSLTVFEHVYNTIASTPKTFTVIKHSSDITNYTEKFCGNGITGISIKSGKGRIMLSAKVEGLGANYEQGVSDPVAVFPITTADEDPHLGVNSNLLIDGVSVTKGELDANWSIDIDFGARLLSTAGSTDGSVTRFDLQEWNTLTANFTLYESDVSNLADFLAGSYHTYAFQTIGQLIDVPNALKSLIEFKLTRARVVGEWKSEIGDHGVYKVPITISGIVDTTTGYDLITRVRNLQASY